MKIFELASRNTVFANLAFAFILVAGLIADQSGRELEH